VPGEDWDATIQERLSKEQVILFMVSQDFLASQYITEKERLLAMRLEKEQAAVIEPILLFKCSEADQTGNWNWSRARRG
jgi:hypothetical protein